MRAENLVHGFSRCETDYTETIGVKISYWLAASVSMSESLSAVFVEMPIIVRLPLRDRPASLLDAFARHSSGVARLLRLLPSSGVMLMP